MHRVRRGEFAAVLPGHALTALHYILEKYSGTALANQTLDGLLGDFAIHPVDKANFQRARQLPLSDFEDAVVAVTAEVTRSDFIVTRNVADFVGSSIPAITSIDFLEHLAAVGAE